MKEKPIYEQLGYDPEPPFYAPTSKPIVSNYDRIISKTPEELADWLGDTDACPPGECKHIYDDVDCPECWLDWLKQDAEP